MVLPIATLLCWLTISSKLVSATPTGHVEQRAPYFPEIVRPTASSYWALDHNAFVSWDASKVPSDADPIPWVQLYNTTDTGNANYVATLASNFPAQPGRVDFTVPEVVPGSYFVMLGEYGQSSPHFTIGSIYIPFAPVVISPTATTVWQVGSQQTVVWATDNIPDDNENTVDVQLYKTGDFGGPEFQVTLATGIPPEQGNVSVTVPDVPAGDKYFLMVAHWGNDSPQFSIVQ